MTYNEILKYLSLQLMNEEITPNDVPALVTVIASKTNRDLVTITNDLQDLADNNRSEEDTMYLGFAYLSYYTSQANTQIVGEYFYAASAHTLGVMLKLKEEYAKAVAVLDESAKIFYKLNEIESYAVALGDYGNACFFLGNYKLAVESLLVAYESAKQIGHAKNIIEWSRGLGYAYNSLGQYDTALFFANIALTNAKEIGDSLNEILTVFANIYENLGQIEKSLEISKEALEESIQENRAVNVVKDYFNIGNLYQLLNKHDEAKEHYLKSMELAKQIGNVPSYIESSIALTPYLSTKTREALYLELLQISRKYGLEDHENDLLGNLGGLYIEANPLKAISFLQESIALSEKRDDAVSLILDSLNLATAFLATKEYTKAFNTTEHFVRQINTIKEPNLRWKIYKSHYINMMLLQKDEAEALHYLRHSILSLDTFLNEIKADTDKLTFYNDKHATYKLLIQHYIITGQVEEAFIQNELLKSKILLHSLKKQEENPIDSTEVRFKLDSLSKSSCYVSFATISNDIILFLYSTNTGLSYQSLNITEEFLDNWKTEWSSYISDYYITESGGVHLLKSLGEIIAEPIFQFCKTNNLSKIIMSPASSLMSIPLHALRLTNGKYLIEEFIVTYLPSVSLIKDPLINKSNQCLIFSHSGIGKSYIPNVSIEAKYIEETVPSLLIPEAETTLENFKNTIANVNTIHFSCHSKYRDEKPELSCLFLSETITAKDISLLRLNHIELLFSASCQSVKSISQGLEYDGLIRAWLLAGVNNVVGTYWNLNDPFSLFFVKEYYTTLATQSDFITSYQKAIHKSIKHEKFYAPFYWAGTVFFETTLKN